MQVSTATAAPLVPLLRRVLALVVALALLLASGIAVAQPARAAGLKAVFIVGPTHGLTSMNLNHSEALAQTAERAGMDVRRVFHPNATWDNVLANIQGANLVVYMGHGYGWPSPWAFNENGQNGFGLNPVAGGPASQVKYYGAKQIRANVTLASNALVFLNHLCYAAGNGEEGQAIPGWNIAQQRVDNYAAGLLAAGARGVFAYSYQRFDPTLRALLAGNATMADLFRIRGAAAHPSYGYVGWDDRQLASVRTPGTVNWLDPHSKIGFLRAYSGDPTMTAADWASGAAPPEIEPPPDSAPDTSPPTMPMDLVGTALDRRYVQLSWTASTDDRPGVRYRIRRDGVRIADVSEPSYIDRPPAVGSYSYSLRAIDAAGNKSAWSAPVTVGAVKVALPPPDSGPDTTPPTTPAGLAGSALDRRYVQLSWLPSTDDRAGTITYRIRRNGVRIADVSEPSFRDRPPAVGGYSYTLRAIDAAGNRSAWTSPVSVTAVKVAQPPPDSGPDTTPPSVPANVVGTAYAKRYLGLTWQPSSDDRSGTITYRIRRNGVRIGDATEPSFLDRPPAIGSYSYTLRAIDAAGNKSAWSSPISLVAARSGTPPPIGDSGTTIPAMPDTQPPTVPTNVGAEAQGRRHILLSWRRSTDDRQGTITYRIQRNGVRIATVTDPSYLDRPAVAGVYRYRVRAVDAAGNKSGWSVTVEGRAIRGELR